MGGDVATAHLEIVGYVLQNRRGVVQHGHAVEVGTLNGG